MQKRDATIPAAQCNHVIQIWTQRSLLCSLGLVFVIPPLCFERFRWDGTFKRGYEMGWNEWADNCMDREEKRREEKITSIKILQLTVL